MQSRRALSGMVLSLVFLVAALAPGCTDASSPKDLGLGDDATTERGGNIAASVVVSLDATNAAVGGQVHASAVVKNSRGTVLSRTVTWSVSDTSMAHIEGTVVTAKRAGQVLIRAAVDAVTGQAPLTIGDAKPAGPVASITVALDSSSLTVPHTSQASATLRDSSGTVVGGSVTWSSSNTGVATVSNTGVVSAISAGTANIVASSGTVTGNSAISVVAPVTPIASVVVSLVSTSVNVGVTTQATATALDANNNVLTGRTVSWSSSNTAVATVDPSSGIVTGVSAGTASISANSGGKTGAATITVAGQTAAVGSVTVSLALPSVKVAGTTQATATVYDVNHNVIPGRAVTWSSANTAVAMVNSTTGVVTGVAAGTAGIVATASGISGTAPITVGTATIGTIATVSVSLVATSINVGTSTQATATTRDSSNNIITGLTVAWRSSNTAVATVNSSTGVVTGVTAGSATITAISSDHTGTANITIMSAGATPPASVASVSVSLSSAAITAGATSQATAVTYDSVGHVLTGRTIAWASSNTAVATVNASTGAVLGVGAGSASITGTSGTKTGAATITVSVLPPPPTGTGGTGALSGRVTDLSGAPVAGGLVEVMQGSTIVQTATVNSSGQYSFATLPGGSYSVRLEPPLKYSMGPSEPASHPVSVSGTGTTTSFIVQPAVWADDFQSYTTQTLLAGCNTSGSSMPAGSFFAGSQNVLNCSGQSAISMDMTGGPSGSRAMRYDWAAKPPGTQSLSTYCASEQTIALQPRLGGAPHFDTLWVRMTSKESSNFAPGSQSCASLVGISYKFLLVDYGPMNSAGANGRFGLYDRGLSGVVLPSNIYADMSDRVGDYGNSNFPPMPSANTFHTYVMQIFNMGASVATYRVWVDGVVTTTVNAPFYPGVTNMGGTVLIQLGANINNGPEQAQSRWFRDVGVYTTRPSMLPPP